MIYFGKNLSFLRDQKSLTVTQLTTDIGFTRSQWTNYELGTSFPKFLDLIKIAKYFDITESELIHTDLRIASKPITNAPELNTNEQLVAANLELIQFQREKIKALEAENDRLKKEYSSYGLVAEPEPKLKPSIKYK